MDETKYKICKCFYCRSYISSNYNKIPSRLKDKEGRIHAPPTITAVVVTLNPKILMHIYKNA